ncbi:MAG: chromosome partitioning protein ParA [Opitutaceae bacterium]|nr:chromosome partitioning protein ParA [Opitutaceae bacterium]
MKKTPVIVVALMFGFVVPISGYRGYRAASARTLAAQREADERAAAVQHRLEIERRAAAEMEALRLTTTRNEADAAEAAARFAQLRTDAVAAESTRKAAEEEIVRLTAERERLRLEMEAAQEEARLQAEAREREAAQAEKARNEALQKLKALEQAKQDPVDRETARLAALKHQQELEAAQSRTQRDRSIYPTDYGRREHYYMPVNLFNTNFVRPFVKPISVR